MNLKPYELKNSPRIDKWFRQIQGQNLDLAIHLLEFLTQKLGSNPYPRLDDSKLIKSIKGLKKVNPKCLRVRVYKNSKKAISAEYRFYYTVVTPHLKPEENSGYVVLLEVSGPSDKDKKEAIDRLKRLNQSKFVELAELLGVPV